MIYFDATCCVDSVVERIFQNHKSLQGKKNDDRKFYSVYRQLPDAWVEEKSEIREKIREIQKENKQL